MRIRNNTSLLSYTITNNQLFQRQQKRNTLSMKKLYLTNLSTMYSHKVDTKYNKKYQVTAHSLKMESTIFKENWCEMIPK